MQSQRPILKLQALTFGLIALAQTCALPLLPPAWADDGIPSEVSTGTAQEPALPDVKPLPMQFGPSKSDLDQLSAGSGAHQGKVTTTKVEPAAAAHVEHAATAHPVANTQPPLQAQAKTTKLYGRIEEIAQGSGANFPIKLQAMKPQFDYSQDNKKLAAQASATNASLYSGTIAKSFPQDFSGNWGGELAVWWCQQMPSAYQLDPVKATKTDKIFARGNKGLVNFVFANTAQGMTLEPARMLFHIQGKDTDTQAQLQQMMGGSMASMGPMAQMMESMAANMQVPVSLYLGNYQTSGFERGLSGGSARQTMIKNVLRQLAPNVLEQQVVSQGTEEVKSTGRSHNFYQETVIRFTRTNPQQMYAQVVVVTYGPDRKFLDKVILYGYVTKGQVVNTDPMASMGGMGGLGGMMPMLAPGQGAGGGSMQLPQLPPGFDIKKLLGQ